MKPVIICGGIGSKMWPMSRSTMPKHFLPILGGKSLFQLNYEALRLKFEPSDIYIQTNALQAEIAKKQVKEIPKENIFVEPEMRNQGPATGFAAAMLYKKFPDEPFMLVQADVLRRSTDDFLGMVEKFDSLIKSEGKLVTGGLKPSYAVMGVDYLIVDKKTDRMIKWLGRGSKEDIEKYLAEGKALIHTNHYAWTPRLMLECMKRRKPEWYEPLMNIVNGKDIATEYAKMPKGPIEEITQFELEDGYVIKLPFEWMDFGTWESVANFLQKEGLYNPDEDVMEIDANDNFIYKKKKKFIATIGIKNSIIVDTGDALLVMEKSQSNKVGEIVETLRLNKREELL